MDDRIQEGMTVYSADGEKLGRVVQRGESTFLIEKGFFFPKDYLAQYGDIGRVAEGDVYLSSKGMELREASEGGGTMDAGGGMETGAMESGVSEEVRVPLVEEEVDVEKRTREAGQVRIRKDVITEEKQVTVPVTREEVTVETVAVSDSSMAAEGGSTFQEQEIVVPVREEEIEIHKRPVVKKEVRVSKVARQEQRTAGTTVRKEVADVDDDRTGTRQGLDDEEIPAQP